jgi:hypothetical protein
MKMTGGGTDGWSPAVEIESRRGSRLVQFSSNRWLGWRCTRGEGRWWPLAEEEAARSGAFADCVAIGLGSRSMSTEVDVEVEASAALDSHGRAWWWSAMAKHAMDDGEQRACARRRKGSGGLSPAIMHEGIRPPRHVSRRRPAVIGAGTLSTVSVVTTW